MARRRASRKKKQTSNYAYIEFNTITYLVIFVLVFLGSMFLLSFRVLADSVAPITCTPTTFVRDGVFLTTAQYNPPGPVTGDVDATGCDIGVYYDNSTGFVSGANIHGARYFGVVVNAGTNNVSVDVKNSQIYQIGDLPFDGAQHGVGIYYTAPGSSTATGQVSQNTVYRYQKGGIVVAGSGATVDVTGNTVSGLGPVDYIAQNGVQFSSGAGGSVTENKVSNNFYTGTVGVGPNPGGQNPPGWQYTSGGLLLYQAGNVMNSQNHYSGNQKNLEMVP